MSTPGCLYLHARHLSEVLAHCSDVFQLNIVHAGQCFFPVLALFRSYPFHLALQQISDYIIVGGVLSGCVIASRLCQARPTLPIALIEAGPDQPYNPAVLSLALYPTLHGTPLQHSYQSSPQSQLEGRKIPNWGRRLCKLF